jgi:L-ascorbate metabolism protein UlaG (beta-lactamase superfamily)
MDIQFFGANCVRIAGKKAAVVVDDTLSSMGLKSVIKQDDIAVFTQPNSQDLSAKLVVDCPGEFEASGVSVHGVAARAHMDEAGELKATMYKIDVDDVRVVVVGHIHPDITGDELEELGTVDVLLIPVGGGGYTLDPVGALKVIKAIEPKIVIPTHYADSNLNYEVPQIELAEALKSLAMEPAETTAKLKLKAADLPEVTQLVVVERT